MYATLLHTKSCNVFLEYSLSCNVMHETSKVAMAMASNVIISHKYKMAAWTVPKVSELIELLQQYPHLYDTKNKSYHDRDIRGKALNCIKTIRHCISYSKIIYCVFTFI